MGDILFFSAFGLIGPIFAVFITNQISGATIATAGFAATVNLLTRSILQLPIARYIDRKKGERDDFLLMVVGSTLVSVVPFLYLFVSTPFQLYLAQFVLALAAPSPIPAGTRFLRGTLIRKKKAPNGLLKISELVSRPPRPPLWVALWPSDLDLIIYF